jgi:segregation and condensation protein B
METLAVVAYRQPVLRADIESVRGVQCGEILRQLMERNLVRIVGRSEELGRPFLYGTTRRFLTVFGLRHLEELPRMGSFGPGRTGSGCIGAKPAARQDSESQVLKPPIHSTDSEGELHVKTALDFQTVLEEPDVRETALLTSQRGAIVAADEDYDDEDFDDEEELDEEDEDDEEADDEEEELDDDEDLEEDEWEEVGDEDDEEEDEEDLDEEDDEDWEEEDWDDEEDEEDDEEEDWEEEEEEEDWE